MAPETTSFDPSRRSFLVGTCGVAALAAGGFGSALLADDAWAADVVRRALGEPLTPDALDPAAVAAAAATLRAAADTDDELAQWLAASVGPVDLDEPDADVVLAVLAAAVATSLAPSRIISS